MKVSTILDHIDSRHVHAMHEDGEGEKRAMRERKGSQ